MSDKREHRSWPPQVREQVFLCHTGMETDLIFNRGVDLPGFASYPLLETEDGRELLKHYLVGLVGVARENGLGAILESPTWMANRDRGARLDHSPERLRDANRESIALLEEVRRNAHDCSVLLSANLGPRSDAYAPTERMTADEARRYHAEQLSWLADTAVDLVSGYTVAYPEEATGMVLAARDVGLPAVVAFTVEIDGRLPTGTPLGAAIESVDRATDGYAAYFMINCAHPTHFADVLSDEAPWMARLGGLVANASRCSHAELDEATELDDGDPEELGRELAALQRTFPQIMVLGGCCGTDLRHIERIAAHVTAGRYPN